MLLIGLTLSSACARLIVPMNGLPRKDYENMRLAVKGIAKVPTAWHCFGVPCLVNRPIMINQANNSQSCRTFAEQPPVPPPSQIRRSPASQ